MNNKSTIYINIILLALLLMVVLYSLQILKAPGTRDDFSKHIPLSGPPRSAPVDRTQYLSMNSLGDDTNYLGEKFVAIRKIDGSNSQEWKSAMTLTTGGEYEVRANLSNTSDPSKVTLAGTEAKVQTSQIIKEWNLSDITVEFSNDKATPSKIFDSVTVVAPYGMTIRYVPGSAFETQQLDISTAVKPLPNELFGEGAKLDCSSLDADGNNGCLIKFRFIVDVPNFGLFLESKKGEATWSTSSKIYMRPDEHLYLRVSYVNSGTTNQENVFLIGEKDGFNVEEFEASDLKFPAGEGKSFNQYDDLFSSGLNIGEYGPGQRGVLQLGVSVTNDFRNCSGSPVTFIASTDNGTREKTLTLIPESCRR